jgi:acetylornithine aminotransferase
MLAAPSHTMAAAASSRRAAAPATTTRCRATPPAGAAAPPRSPPAPPAVSAGPLTSSPPAAAADPAAWTRRVVEDEAKYVLQTYARPSEVVFTRGEGATLFDAAGRPYLDMAAGIAVNCLGHGDARWVSALVAQAPLLTHTSNLFHTSPQVDLARRLVTSAPWSDKVFFCNSGAEANEAAIKFARKLARVRAGVDPQDAALTEDDVPTEIVAFTSCFHGRTMGTLALTYKVNYRTPFMPVMPGGKLATFNDLESARSVIKKGKTAAVFVEPIQGEGGCTPGDRAFLQGLRELCDEAGAALVFDEVQCGLGRSGALWAHELLGVQPDIMTVAKPLAGGLPIGAALVSAEVAAAMAPGDHGSTYAGNPLVCSVANAVFDIIAEPTFLDAVRRKGDRLREKLREATRGNPKVVEVRGEGLLVGVQLDRVAGPVVDEARKREALLVITAGKGDVVRLVPPLTIEDAEIDACAEKLGRVLREVEF